MHKIDDASAAISQPTTQPAGPVPNGWFRSEDESLGQSATIITSDWLNSIQAEIANVILGAGLTLNKASQNQLFTAIQSLINTVVNDVSPNVLTTITQTGHGFAKGELLYKAGNTWTRAIATSLATSWTLGMVYDVESTATFRVLMLGFISGLTGLTSGTIYYASTTTPGALQSTRPSVNGQVIKPVLIADSATSGYFFNWLPIVAGTGGGGSGDMLAANNLSDLADIPTARDNLGLGTAALSDTSDFLAASSSTDFFAVANSLGELQDAAAARTNLGLGTAAVSASTDFIAATDYTDFAQAADLTTLSGTVSSLSTTVAGKQPLDATITALAGVVTAANQLIYATGVDAFATSTITTYGRSLIDDADAPIARATLGLGTAATSNIADFIAATDYGDFAQAVHTHVLADITDVTATATQVNYLVGVTSAVQTQLNNKQPLDATLSALASIATAADKLIYATGSDAFATADFSAFARTVVDDSNQAAMQATLGLVPGTNVQAHSSVLDATTASYTTALDTKLGGIATGADVTATYLSGTLTGTTVATDDKVLIQDTSTSNSLKTVTVQSIVDLAGSTASQDVVLRLAGGTLTNVSQMIIQNLSTAYIRYLIVCSDIVSAAVQASLYLTTSTDNGSTFAISNYTYRTSISSAAAANYAQSASATIGAAFLLRDIGNTSNRFQSINIEIFNPMDSSTRTTVKTRGGGLDYNGNPIGQDNMAQRDVAEANNAVRIFSNNGGSDLNFSMNYVLYGYVA